MVSSLSLRYSAHLEISPLAMQLPHGIDLRCRHQHSTNAPILLSKLVRTCRTSVFFDGILLSSPYISFKMVPRA